MPSMHRKHSSHHCRFRINRGDSGALHRQVQKPFQRESSRSVSENIKKGGGMTLLPPKRKDREPTKEHKAMMTALKHEIWIKARATKGYQAISTAEGVGTWWDKQRAVETDWHLVLEHDPGPEHGVVKMKVLDLTKDRELNGNASAFIPRPVLLRRGRVHMSSLRLLGAWFFQGPAAKTK